VNPTTGRGGRSFNDGNLNEKIPTGLKSVGIFLSALVGTQGFFYVAILLIVQPGSSSDSAGRIALKVCLLAFIEMV
jgi:hypothetical protein